MTATKVNHNPYQHEQRKPTKRVRLAKVVGVLSLFPGSAGSAIAYQYYNHSNVFLWLCSGYFFTGAIVLLSLFSGGIKDT